MVAFTCLPSSALARSIISETSTANVTPFPAEVLGTSTIHSPSVAPGTVDVPGERSTPLIFATPRRASAARAALSSAPAPGGGAPAGAPGGVI
jgi:hypothetical protein